MVVAYIYKYKGIIMQGDGGIGGASEGRAWGR